MKRKVLLATIAAMLMLCVTCTGAFACGRPSNGPSQRELQLLYQKVETANTQILIYTIWAMITPYDDVDWLLARVDAIVGPVFAYADSIGAKVVCEYDYYWIDGRIVKIDPLKVINVGSDRGGNN